jgi:hypothetical protein
MTGLHVFGQTAEAKLAAGFGIDEGPERTGGTS